MVREIAMFPPIHTTHYTHTHTNKQNEMLPPQVLVYHDLLGMISHPHHAKVAPKFCKRYADVGASIQAALQQYRDEVGVRLHAFVSSGAGACGTAACRASALAREGAATLD